MRLLLVLLLLGAAPAEAFLFFGGARDRKAAAGLKAMREAYEAGDCAAALALSEPFLKEKPPAAMREEAYGYMGRCYESSGSTDKAMSLYGLAIGLYPENSLFSSRLALIYNQAGFPEKAAPLFLKVIALRPGDPEASLGLGRAYAALGFLSRAKEYYSRAVVLQEFRDASVLEEYARCMLRKRDWDEAFFLVSKGELLTPRSAAWALLRARAHAGKGEYAKAVSQMDRAAGFAPSRRTRLERALYLLLGGLPRRAAEAADAELSSSPGDPLASAVKGMALYALGEKAAAEPFFAAARRGGPFMAGLAASFTGGGERPKEDACAN